MQDIRKQGHEHYTDLSSIVDQLVALMNKEREQQLL
jgi:hypothetical protein